MHKLVVLFLCFWIVSGSVIPESDDGVVENEPNAPVVGEDIAANQMPKGDENAIEREPNRDEETENGSNDRVPYNMMNEKRNNIARQLIRYSVNDKDTYGRTPLHDAIVAGKIDIVEALLDSGADVNIKDAIGRTAIHYCTTAPAGSAIMAIMMKRDLLLQTVLANEEVVVRPTCY